MNKYSFNSILLLFSTIFMSINAYSQTNLWEEYYIDNQLKIEYKNIVCEFSSTASQEMIVFKFSNLTNRNITLDYETTLWHNETKVNTEQNQEEFRKTIRLEANEIIEINCQKDLKEFAIFSGFIHNETLERFISLTKFELININIKNE